MKLERSFFTRSDVVQISRDLIGKLIFTNFNGGITGGIIIETEAYEGITDRASHAFAGRRTKRTAVMFSKGGVAYVYLCYGIHSLFNIVTNEKDIPHAVLIRGILPVDGLDIMKMRTQKGILKPGSGLGPGKVSKLLGIHFSHTGLDLTGDKIWLEDRGVDLRRFINTSARIGIAYAGDDAFLPYRFWVQEEKVRT
jgi:DNA-3-methyladenine glycosylase